METNKNKVLFLDMDGVLNIEAGENPTFKTTSQHFEWDLVSKLNNLLDVELLYEIIISSSWRDDMDDLQRQLEKVGFRHWDRVIGRTAFADISRGQLIMDVVVARKIVDYVVLDDYIDNIICCDIIDEFRVIKTDSYTGISDENIKDIKRILNV